VDLQQAKMNKQRQNTFAGVSPGDLLEVAFLARFLPFC